MAFSESSKLAIHSYEPTKKSTSTPLCSSISDSGYHSRFTQTPFLNPRPAIVTPAESPLPPSSFSTVQLSDSVVQVLFQDGEDFNTIESSLDLHSIADEISSDFSIQSSVCDMPVERLTFQPPITQGFTEAVIESPKRLLPQKQNSLSGWFPGQEIGEAHVDFFRELGHYRNCHNILSQVYSYLSPEDLVNVGQVCHNWRTLIESSPKFSYKRNSYLQGRRFCGPGYGKENHQTSGKPRPKGPRTFGLLITDFVNQVQVPQPPSPTKLETPRSTSRLPRFQEQAKKLLPCEHLQPCPRCLFPSRVTPGEKRAHCTSTQCSFDYCTQCKSNFHAPTPCKRSLLAGSIIRSPNKKDKRDLIGHKGARRNLKRL